MERSHKGGRESVRWREKEREDEIASALGRDIEL